MLWKRCIVEGEDMIFDPRGISETYAAFLERIDVGDSKLKLASNDLWLVFVRHGRSDQSGVPPLQPSSVPQGGKTPGKV